MERIGQLTARQREDALLWLAGYAPAFSDAMTSGPGRPGPSEVPAPIRRVHVW